MTETLEQRTQTASTNTLVESKNLDYTGLDCHERAQLNKKLKYASRNSASYKAN